MMKEASSSSSDLNPENRLLQREFYDNPLAVPKKNPISTRYGYVLVTRQGSLNKPAIITYHDMAMNSESQFHHFFANADMSPILEHFTVYHINAPGQEDQANPLPLAENYPTMDKLAESVNDIFKEFDIKSAIGFGVGFGANVLTRFALKYPSKIYGLILLNCVTRSAKLFEGFSLKWPTKDISEEKWTESLMNYLLWYHLGPDTQKTQPDLEDLLRRHLEENINVKNVVKLMNSYFKRTTIHLERPSLSGQETNTLTCSVLNVTGISSPHKNDVIETNDNCDPTRTTYVEFTDCGGAILDEQPAKLAEAIRLFLQGLGHMSHLSIPRYSTAARLTEQIADYRREHGSFSKVPRQLSSQIDAEIQLRIDSLDNQC